MRRNRVGSPRPSASAAPRDLALSDRLPPAETAAQRRSVHAVAVLALMVSVVYLVWRLGWTMGVWWLSIPLWLLEAHAVAGLALYTFSLWDLHTTPTDPDATGPRRVAVLIATYNEPEEVLLPAIAGAVALPEPHQTLVLDDGDRPWVAELAARLGARYVTREVHDHAKAGNLNHAIEVLGDEVDIIAVLDADHVPTEGFLTHTLGYFADPRIALVQTPQDFYNAGSFEHAANRSLFWRSRRSAKYNEQALFYRAIQAGKNRWNASFWCGTNALIRLAALRGIGGVATASLTEDIATSLRLHRNGWRTAYHNEVLACGLAARNMTEYQAQRLRWGTGAMELLRRERPITGPALSLPQRLSYAATLLGWFDAWRTLGYVVLPMVALITGRLPIRSDVTTFVIAFTTTFILQRIAMALLARGFAPQGIAAVFEMIRLPVTLQATLTFLSIRDRAFVVTPKGRAERTTSVVPRLLLGLIVASGAALGVFAATLLGWTAVHYEQRGAAIGTALFASANCLVLVVAVARIRSERFAGDRRRGERFQVNAAGRLGSRRAEIVDISVSGALVSTTAAAGDGERVVLTLDFASETVLLDCVERSRRPVSPAGTFMVGLEFATGQPEEIAVLTRRLFGTGSTVSRWARISSAA